MLTFSINFLTVDESERNEESQAASSKSSNALRSSVSFFFDFSILSIEEKKIMNLICSDFCPQ